MAELIPMQPKEQTPEQLARQYKQALTDLSQHVSIFLRQLDQLMHNPSTPERGKQLAVLCNALDLANDRVRYFTLGYGDYRTGGVQWTLERSSSSPHTR